MGGGGGTRGLVGRIEEEGEGRKRGLDGGCGLVEEEEMACDSPM
jgi:hypothetical protein